MIEANDVRFFNRPLEPASQPLHTSSGARHANDLRRLDNFRLRRNDAGRIDLILGLRRCVAKRATV